MMLSWQHLLAFLVAIALLVAVHEFGHYWVARRLGFKVLRFSIGFGPPLITRVAGADRTEYMLSAIPLGGYVKLLDEREGEVASHEVHRAFTRRPHWQRILVLLAGPAFNFIFAILLLAGMYFVSGITELRPVIGPVRIDSPAYLAGLRNGDTVIRLDGQPVQAQSAVMLGLLDRLTGAGRATLTLTDDSGRQREVVMQVNDAKTRRELTEPDRLMSGLGFSFWQPPIAPVLGTVVAGGPAAAAGLQAGDRVLSVDGEPITDFLQLRQKIEPMGGRSAVIGYLRAGTEVTARIDIPAEKVGERTIGRIHVTPAPGTRYPDSMLHHQSLGPLQALGAGVAEAWNMTALQARMFWRMLRGQVSIKNLSGPLTIAEYAGDSAAAGAGAFLGFLVLISLSLGFLNLLPIPMLDGGQVVYQAIEWLRGAPLPERAQAIGQQFGIALLVLLMGVAMFNDIARQFG
ncbi:MAG: RIP metalloprotease RseP [Proteobacteria bacterium]|nr:RIP metalloprotease RseP [Pseudomonadota bacterium]